MKVFESRPEVEVIIVRPDKGGSDYEFWVLRPELIGGARKVGTQRIVTDDNHQFSNLSSAGRYMLEQRGEMKLAQTQPHRVRKIRISGWDLVKRGVWVAFCELRSMDYKIADMNADYMLEPNEAQQVGIIEG